MSDVRSYVILAAGIALIILALTAGFGLDAAWYWWGLIGLGIGAVKAA